MKHFYITITTQYDGMEWLERAVTIAKDVDTAKIKADKFDFTHDNGIEEQEPANVQAITEEEYKVLSKYLVIV